MPAGNCVPGYIENHLYKIENATDTAIAGKLRQKSAAEVIAYCLLADIDINLYILRAL